MKKILLLALPLLLLLSSCSKEVGTGQPIDEENWIHRERGIVVASSFDCPYFVVEAENGYTLLKSWDGAAPYQGSLIYGDFSSWGLKRFYNRSERYLMDADVREYWLSYFGAIDEMDYRCNY